MPLLVGIPSGGVQNLSDVDVSALPEGFLLGILGSSDQFQLTVSNAVVDHVDVESVKDNGTMRWLRFVPGGDVGVVTPAADSVPKSDGEGQLLSGWLPPSVPDNERYCAPGGDDTNAGDSWERPLQYLRTAWTQLYTLGGGTIHVADLTEIDADGNGFFIQGAWGPAHSVGPMPVRVIGHSTTNGGSQFIGKPSARIQGGAVVGSSDIDNPCIWIAHTVGTQMSFENLRSVNGVMKPVRVGWDYTRVFTEDPGDPNYGTIMKANVTAADRANGETVFTVDPFTFGISHIKRVGSTVTVTMDRPAASGAPVRQGMTVTVRNTGVADGEFSVTGYTTEAGYPVFTYTNAGAPFDAGVAGGPSIAEFDTNLAAPLDYLTLYSDNAEFPTSTYRIVAADMDTITVTDYYGYSPRSATASEVGIGTYAIQDRYSHNIARVDFDNVSGNPRIDDNTIENFISGPGVDIGPMQFYQWRNLSTNGFNIKSEELTPDEYGCRDPERRASLLMDVGSAAAGVANGIFDNVQVSNGGIRYRIPRDASITANINHVCVDTPVGGGYLGVPAVHVIDGAARMDTKLLLGDVQTVDTTSDVPNILIDDGLPPQAVTVVQPYGTVTGPCTMVDGQNARQQQAQSVGPNYYKQTGYWGDQRNIAGRHQGIARNQPVVTTPFESRVIKPYPTGWSVSGTITPTTGVRDPFGGTNAVRFTASDAGNIIPYASHFSGGNSDNGDIVAGAIWLRGSLTDETPFRVLVYKTTDNTEVYLSLTATFQRQDGGEWNCYALGGRLSGIPAPTTNTTMQMITTMANGDEIDMYMPQLFLLRASEHSDFNDVSDNELPELITNLLPAPYYLERGMAGTMDGIPLVGHGGLGVGHPELYAVGVGPGQLTIVGSFSPAKYTRVRMVAADGTITYGFVELIDASINP